MNIINSKALLPLFFMIPVYTCTMDNNPNNQQQLWSPNPWVAITAHTYKSLTGSLRTICKELSTTLDTIQGYSSFIPHDKKNAIDKLLNKWLHEAQSHLDSLTQSQDLKPADTFVSLYDKQEKSIGESILSIEKMIQQSQDPDTVLVDLINELSLNGQITDELLIASLSLGDKKT